MRFCPATRILGGLRRSFWRLAEELLADWSGTIREALVAVEALRAA